jgi:hypothetical protein
MTGKSSFSNANSYQELGEFWDEHDATEFGEQTEVDEWDRTSVTV